MISTTNAKVISISLTPEEAKELRQLAREERRTVSEIMEEAFRQYATDRLLESVRKDAKKRVKKLNITPAGIVRIIRKERDSRDRHKQS